MERIDRILNHDLFIENLKKNKEAEANRRFCRHDITHFLDVARIGRIINLEEGLEIPTELIYAAALLHDIGKHRQYREGIPHEKASAEIAPVILKECGFEQAETDLITEAISRHRNSEIAYERSLIGLLYRADKASRACFACDAEQDCNWKREKKNLYIGY
ncbi:MAG: HD domain-containing protein [Acetatifactor sp.]